MNSPAKGASPGAASRRPGRKSQLAGIAATLFCERGYHAVGLGDIAAEAGITGPAIYRHFRNKQAILAHAAHELADALDTARVAADGELSPWEALDSLLGSLAALAVERRRGAQLYQWERRYLDRADHDRVVEAVSTLITRTAELLGRARPHLPAEDRTTLAAAALSAVASISTHRTQVPARQAKQALRGFGLGVLATGLPPRTEPVHRRGGGPVVAPFMSRRERLLVAAPRPFRERGFPSVTMEDLGAAAGISASSVYRHFASKSELLAAVYYRAAERLAAASGSAIESARDAGEALRGLVEAYVGYTLQDTDLAAVYLSEHGNLPEHDRHTLRKAQREHVERWVRLVTATRTGESGDAAHVRLAVHAALNIVHDLAIGGHDLADSEQLRQIVFTVLTS